jgi:hypothetical protein
MPTEDGFAPDDSFPLFLVGHADVSGRADEHEERGSLLLLNACILLLAASLVAMAIILSSRNPTKIFLDIKASLSDISAVQADTVQSTPTIQSKALLPSAVGAPTRHEVATTFDAADQTQAEISAAPPGALLKQFEDWAAKEDARAQIETVRRALDARAQVLQSAHARALPTQKH